MTRDSRSFWCFVATLAAIVVLSKIGGTGADLAIMTGLIGVLGMLARPGVPDKIDSPTDVNVTNSADDPVPIEERRP